MSTEPAKYRAPALDKGLDILELLARQAQPMSMGAISQGIGRSRGRSSACCRCWRSAVISPATARATMY